jgi:hypothetical protein
MQTGTRQVIPCINYHPATKSAVNTMLDRW